MEYKDVKNPIWANAEHSQINCEVDFVDLDENYVKFTADPNDVFNKSSKEIFDDCVAGKYGEIAEYVPPPPYVPTAEKNKEIAISLLQQTDWVNQPDVIDVSLNPHLLNHAEFITYRSALRNIAVNPTDGFINFPTKPQEQWSS